MTQKRSGQTSSAHPLDGSDPDRSRSGLVGAPDRILRLRGVIDRTGFSKTTIYRKIAEGTFPRQIQISTRCSGWRESMLDRWMSDPLRYRDHD
jgi:prophage regulatory protein